MTIENYPLCNGIGAPNEVNEVPLLQKWIFVDEIEEAVSRPCRNAESLLLNFYTNLVEAANGILSEKIGEKRINYALRNEYHVRIQCAALQFNTRRVLSTYYKAAGKNVPNIIETVEANSIKKHERRKAKKNNCEVFRRRRRRVEKKGYDKHYGPNCEKPDMNPDTYALQLVKQQGKLKEMMANRVKHEEETRDQNKSPEWRRLRKQFVTASICHRICRKREYTSCHSIVKDIRKPVENKSPAFEWGESKK